LEYYNAVLSHHVEKEFSILTDNEQRFNILKRWGVKDPNYTDVNKLIASNINSIIGKP